MACFFFFLFFGQLVAGFNTSWNKLSGEKHWEGLMGPNHLDEDLREYIVHYGQRSQAIGDAFNGETVSTNYAQNRYSKERLFKHVGLDYSPYKYEVTEYIFANEIAVNAWIGYVAVATDDGAKVLGRRDILVVWRGTSTTIEEIADYTDLLFPGGDILNGAGIDAMVHVGWLLIYAAVKETVRTEVKRLVNLYKDENTSITVAGHSMGGALATLNAVDLCSNHYNEPSDQSKEGCLVTVFAYASPKVGNEPFKNFFNGLEKLRCLRIVNAVDFVPQLPPIRYYHVGDQLMVDSRQSPYLKNITAAGIGGFLVIAHQLETYLHLVRGTQGIDKEFNLTDLRYLSLVNKGGDYLDAGIAKQIQIPSAWWVVKTKAMVEQADGSWVLKDAPETSNK